MKHPISLTITEADYSELYSHLFPGDDDEHGAVLAVGVSQSENGTRLLVRKVFVAEDTVDYVPGQFGYRALTANFVAQTSDFCLENKLGYLAVHCHSGTDNVKFSHDDYVSHKRGYPALLQLLGEPVGALVFAKNAVAGEIWTDSGIIVLDNLKIVGSQIKYLFSMPQRHALYRDPIYDRHARLFGDLGQMTLKKLRVGIIGLGGGGSLINEWISRLGVGEIVAIDFDKIESSNLPRIVGSKRIDCWSWFATSKSSFVKKFIKRFSRYKVHIARRVALKANPDINYTAIVGNIIDEKVALMLRDVDFIFLASDNIASRNVFNALLHQYLIPGAQIGSKVRIDKNTSQVSEIFTVGRLVIPSKGEGCLACNGWIPPSRLQQELLSDQERRDQRYVDDDLVTEPSVITLNVSSASQVVNDFMMIFTGLYPPEKQLNHQLHDVLNREHNEMDHIWSAECLHCGNSDRSNYAKGDRGELPCRI